MANPIANANISPRQYVGVASRYAGSTVLYYGTNSIITFATYKRTAQTLSNGDKYAIITKGVEFRPDLASFQFYGVSDFWWRIMEANGMDDVMQFQAGVNIRLPNLLMNKS